MSETPDTPPPADSSVDDSLTPPLADDHPLKAPRLEKLAALRADGIDPYPHSFRRTARAAALQDRHAALPADTASDEQVAIAGRIRALRNSGMFIDLHDASGKIQVFSHKDHLDDASLALLKRLDLGDILGVEGSIRRTKRGELTVDAAHLTLLSKTLLPLPEKYHGLTDVEQRYRQRYVDLIMSEESRQVFRRRAQILAAFRAEFAERGFVEVETPLLHPLAGGASARPFRTHHNTLDLDLFLRIAPELYLKRLIVGGLADGVYEIGRCFRNEGLSPRHNPEFTMLECYEAYTDFHDVMALTEALIARACRAIHGRTAIVFQGRDLDVAGPYPKRSMADLVRDATGVDFLALPDAAAARDAARGLGAEVETGAGWGHALAAAFEARVEETLIDPVHVIEFPRDVSPLAKAHRTDSRLTERFETYVNGWEVANGFSELSDPQDQFERFLAQVQARDAGDEEAQMMDRDYVRALEYGLPPTGGLGVGIDRLTMLLADVTTIRDVIAFPTLRPRQG